MKRYITKYHKGLFGRQRKNNFSLDESMIDDIAQVSNEENEILIASFSEKEVRDAIFQMKHNKASGPDGFPAELYQIFWSLIKDDLVAMFRNFHNGELLWDIGPQLPLFSLNFGVITLLPKL